MHDLERSRRFYTSKLDFAETWRRVAGARDATGKQKSACSRRRHRRWSCSQPVGEGGRAARYLRKHPDGVGTLIFEVEDIEKTFRAARAARRHAIDDIQTFTDDAGGKLRQFSITTPFGDTTFRFVQRDGYRRCSRAAVARAAQGGKNKFGFEQIDHVTSNFQTMKPMLLWMEHVMGFEQFWEVEFHTEDVAASRSASTARASSRS